MSVVRARATKLGIMPDFYQKHDFHVHVPEGATPKETTSDSESNSTPNILVVFVSRAIIPSSTSKKPAETPLNQMRDGSPCPSSTALQVCDALMAAHEGPEPVVHRDPGRALLELFEQLDHAHVVRIGAVVVALDPTVDGFDERAEEFYSLLGRLTGRGASAYRRRVRDRASRQYVLLVRDLDEDGARLTRRQLSACVSRHGLSPRRRRASCLPSRSCSALR